VYKNPYRTINAHLDRTGSEIFFGTARSILHNLMSWHKWHGNYTYYIYYIYIIVLVYIHLNTLKTHVNTPIFSHPPLTHTQIHTYTITHTYIRTHTRTHTHPHTHTYRILTNRIQHTGVILSDSEPDLPDEIIIVRCLQVCPPCTLQHHYTILYTHFIHYITLYTLYTLYTIHTAHTIHPL
jgi:hypothetical protein